MTKSPAIFGDFLTRLMSRSSPPRAMRLTKEDMLAIEEVMTVLKEWGAA